MRRSAGLMAAALALSAAPPSLTAKGAAATEVAGISVARGPAAHIEVPHFAQREAAVVVDGRLDEAIWAKLPSYDGMKVTSPDTMAEPAYPTLMRYFHTDQGLYIGVKLVQPPETLVARLSGRDQFINRDGFGITLDTSGDGHYGYWFAVNLGGSVMDGKVAPERRYTNQWDGPWRHGTAELADGWSLEMFLPWSMMAMPKSEGPRRMGFWTNRKVAHLDERWSAPPRPFTVARFMSDLGQMRFGEVQPRRQLDFFPHASYTYDGIEAEDHYRLGLDLFWRPSSNLQVTATANPDFGAVESDDVVVNLTAFETFFPEKRLFFLEGNEVFETTPRSRVPPRSTGSSGARRTQSTYYPTPTTLVNTRRIGGPPRIDLPDDLTAAGAELGRPTELLGAAKVTGQRGGWRYGLLTAFEDDVRRRVERNGRPVRWEQDGRQFGVARLLHEASGEGRLSVGYLGTLTRYEEDQAVVHGLDAHLLSSNGKITWDGQFMASKVAGERGYGGFMDLNYIPNREWRHRLSLDYADKHLDISDLGFLRRNDNRNLTYRVWFNRSQGLRRLRNRTASLFTSYEQNSAGQVVRSAFFFRTGWMFHSRNQISTELAYFPAQWDDRNSFGNGTYKIDRRWTAELSFGTDTGKPLSLSLLVGRRNEHLGGSTFRAAGGLTYKPNDRFSLELDAEYRRRNGWLLHQEDRNMTTFAATEWRPTLALDLFLSARQHLRFTMQWTAIRADERAFWTIPASPGRLLPATKAADAATDDFSISRMTAQLRYRWEIGPLSDLFLVYTRGSNLEDGIDDSFSGLFQDALTKPVIDLCTLKLRYRLGR